MTIIIVLGVLLFLWLVCGVASYGISYGYFQNQYPTIAEDGEAEDRQFALSFSCGGPISLLIALFEREQVQPIRFRRYKYIDGIRQV